MAKNNFKKIAASRIVSWEFSVVSWEFAASRNSGFLRIFGNLRGQLYMTTTIPQSSRSRAFFLCAKDHATFQFCLYCNTADIQNYLICPICLTGNCATCFCFLKTVRFYKTFDKVDANDRRVFRWIKSKFSFNQLKMTKFG